MENAAKTENSGGGNCTPSAEGASTRRSKPGKRNNGRCMELSLKIHDDGGPVFSSLAAIKDAHIRCDRIRQLLYHGLMHEVEMLRSSPMAMGVPMAYPSPAPAQPAPISVGAVPASQGADPGQARYHPSDIDEWFGA